jgi:cytidylate kinase
MSSTSGEHAPVVTLAALYGAAGSVIGPRVAERLGVPFLDRAIPEGAARRTGGSDAAVVDVDEQPRTGLQRLTAGLGRLSTITGGAGGTHERLDADEHEVRIRVEEFLAEACRSGGVALGRGGMVILRSVPWALHVHLGGSSQARVDRAMVLEGIDRTTAAARQQAEDAARESYVRRVYGVDGEDPAWYHLMLDATALGHETCVELIVAAAIARIRDPRPSPPI